MTDDVVPQFQAGNVIDGYRLVRVIGQGGFGRVWLCISETLGHHFALKEIHDMAGAGERELKAVQKFKELGLGSTSGLMPIEHVGRADGRLFYVMPLSDGAKDVAPTSADWQPLTLGLLICNRRQAATWFSSREIIDWLVPVIRAADAINRAGLVHRDIKPENILFIRGNPILSDISLLREDGQVGTLSREIGTPGFRAPSWYLESGGSPDMYGLAATLYVALTGNDPDTMGKKPERYWWPPQGKETFSAAELGEWEQFHRTVLKATCEDKTERPPNIELLATALLHPGGENEPRISVSCFLKIAGATKRLRLKAERMVWRIVATDVRKPWLHLQKLWYLLWLVVFGVLAAVGPAFAVGCFASDGSLQNADGVFYTIVALASIFLFAKCYRKFSINRSRAWPRLTLTLRTFYHFIGRKPPPNSLAFQKFWTVSWFIASGVLCFISVISIWSNPNVTDSIGALVCATIFSKCYTSLNFSGLPANQNK